MPTESSREFFTTKPREAFYETIELYNSNVGTLRYAARQQFSQQFGLEVGAPRNGGEVVAFQPAEMLIRPTTQEDQPVTKLEIQIGEVGQMVKPYLRQIRGMIDQRLEVIYRTYRGNNTSAPMNNPQILLVQDINFNADHVSLVASDDNPMGVIVARKYLPQDFPGLETYI